MEFIYEPNTNKKFSIKSKKGKVILKKFIKSFILNGGMYKRMTAYEALGLPETATIDEIHEKYHNITGTRPAEVSATSALWKAARGALSRVGKGAKETTAGKVSGAIPKDYETELEILNAALGQIGEANRKELYDKRLIESEFRHPRLVYTFEDLNLRTRKGKILSTVQPELLVKGDKVFLSDPVSRGRPMTFTDPTIWTVIKVEYATPKDATVTIISPDKRNNIVDIRRLRLASLKQVERQHLCQECGMRPIKGFGRGIKAFGTRLGFNILSKFGKGKKRDVIKHGQCIDCYQKEKNRQMAEEERGIASAAAAATSGR